MIAMTCLLTNSGLSYESIHEVAIQGYLDVGLPVLAERCTLFVVEVLKSLGFHREASYVLIKVSKDRQIRQDAKSPLYPSPTIDRPLEIMEQDLRAGLYLEQAAVSFYKNQPPSMRKYAFHLYLSGFRFSKSNFRTHASRNFQTASEIYKGLGWSLIEDHLNFSLGKQRVFENDMKGAVQYYIKLLHKSRQPSSIHRQYLSEFLALYQKLVDQGVDLSELVVGVPLLNDQLVNTVGESLGSTTKSEIWDGMEADIMEYTKTLKMVYDNSGSEPGLQVAVGETFSVIFEWENTMQVPIPINNLILDLQFNGQVPVKTRDLDGFLEYDCFNVDFQPILALDPNEKKIIKLKISPKKPGKIQIIGISYVLCGVIPLKRKFQKTFRHEHIDIVVNVSTPMPVLDIVFHNFPEQVLCGEVLKGTIEVENKGTMGMQGLIYMGSHDFFFLGDPELELDPYGILKLIRIY
jgi:hypothetical protein